MNLCCTVVPLKKVRKQSPGNYTLIFALSFIFLKVGEKKFQPDTNFNVQTINAGQRNTYKETPRPYVMLSIIQALIIHSIYISPFSWGPELSTESTVQ